MVSLGSVLVIQLSRFSIIQSRLRKDQQLFSCSPESELNVSITVEDEVSFSSKYSYEISLITQLHISFFTKKVNHC